MSSIASIVDRWMLSLHMPSASRSFRSQAARFFLTRPIARRRAKQVFDLCAGFVYSQILYACVRLRLFEALSEGPQTAIALSRRLSLAEDAAVRLLDAAVSLRLLAKRRNRYALGPLGAAMIDNLPVTSMIEHHALLYADLADPIALLKAAPGHAQMSEYWPYAKAHGADRLSRAQVADYSALMTRSQPLVTEEVLRVYPLKKHKRLLDVGGGEGGFLCTVASKIAGLQLDLFDIPAVAELAERHIAESGLQSRITVHAGDFLRDRLPAGADIVSLVRVLHDHNDESVRTILRAIHAALPNDGVILIAEPMSGGAGIDAMADAYFGFYLMAMGSGKARSALRLCELLRGCGFTQGRLIPTDLPIQTQILVARAVKC